MRWGKWMVALFVVLTALVPSPWLRAQDETPSAPYLYYYTATQNAFVIERADGTDSRLFGAGLMPDGTNKVDGPGWSPSGKWFAWTSAVEIRPAVGASVYHPHALSVDGTRRVTVLDDFVNAVMAWSPAEDLLFVAGHTGEPSLDEPTGQLMLPLRFALIDPAADRVIFSTDRWQTYLNEMIEEQVFYSYYSPEIFWTDDGQHIIVTYEEDSKRLDEPFHILVFDLQGFRSEKVVEDDDQSRQLSRTLSRGGEMVYLTEDTSSLVVEDLIAGERGVFSAPGGEVAYIHWDPTGQNALIEFSPPGCECTQLWLLTTHPAYFAMIYPHIDGLPWMFSGTEFWSPDGRHAVFMQHIDNKSSQFAQFDMEAMEVHEIPATVPSYYEAGWYWLDDTRVVLPDSYDEEQKTEPVYVYDVTTRTLTSTAEISANYGWQSIPDFSADGRYVVFIWENPVLYDTQSGVVTVIPPHSRSYFSINGGETLWHPSQDWFITRENALYAGGGSIRWTSANNVDGSVHRELTFCWNTPLCINWLPPQVDPTDLAPGHDPAPTLAPATVLHGTHWAWYLSWSPDSTRLIAGRAPDESRNYNHGGPGESTLWAVTTEKPLDTLPLIDWDEEIGWESGPQGFEPQFFNLDHLYGEGYLALSPDGSQGVAWTRVEDTSSGDVLLSFNFTWDGGYPVQVNYSPDGRLLAIPGAWKADEVCLYDTATWEIVGVIPGEAHAVAFSPDGRWLAASIGWDVQIWDVAALLAQGGS